MDKKLISSVFTVFLVAEQEKSNTVIAKQIMFFIFLSLNEKALLLCCFIAVQPNGNETNYYDSNYEIRPNRNLFNEEGALLYCRQK